MRRDAHPPPRSSVLVVVVVEELRGRFGQHVAVLASAEQPTIKHRSEYVECSISKGRRELVGVTLKRAVREVFVGANLKLGEHAQHAALVPCQSLLVAGRGQRDSRSFDIWWADVTRDTGR